MPAYDRCLRSRFIRSFLGALVAVTALQAATAPETLASLGVRKVGTFAQPVYVTAPASDRRRVFVVERRGRIRLIRDGRRLRRPFLDIRRLVQLRRPRDIGSDQGGLLSMAFAPDYRRSGRFYLLYTHRDGRVHVDEFQRSPRSPDRALSSTRRTLLSLPRRGLDDVGGHVAFGPDGLLYASFGFGDTPGASQDLSVLMGKLVRVDPRGVAGRPYEVPPGNPFVARPGTRPEIYAYGLRVPWRFAFTRAGDLLLADVGEERVEELNLIRRRGGAGANLGWPLFEGSRRHRRGAAQGLTFPILQRRHTGRTCSIIGGPVVRNRAYRGLHGRYLYGDLCSGQIRSVRVRNGRARGDRSERNPRISLLSSFGEDARGRLYVVSLSGPVYRLVSGGRRGR